jgi:hypothetical protein
MSASLGTEEHLLELFVKEAEWAKTKSWMGLSSLKPSELTKKVTEKEFGEKEVTEANGWKRPQLSNIEWTVKKGEGETGFTTFENKNAIEFIKAVKEIKEERKLETITVKKEEKQANDKTESKNLFLNGKLTTPITVNEATAKAEFAAGELKLECE